MVTFGGRSRVSFSRDPEAKESGLPRGDEFFQLLWEHREQQRVLTDSGWSDLGNVAPRTIESLGEVLPALYEFAICVPSCVLPDRESHQARYIAGSCYSSAIASFDLIRVAQYQQSLILTRAVGEMANLLFLLIVDEEARDSLARGDDPPRPVEVRRRLGHSWLGRAPIDRDRYAALSRIGVHAVPTDPWISLSPSARTVVDGWREESGALAALNELALAVGAASVGAGVLEERFSVRDEHLVEVGRELVQNTGGVDAIAASTQAWLGR